MNPEVYRHMFELEDRHWWFKGRRAYLSKLLSRFLAGESQLLCEIGCGTGGNLAMIAQYGNVHAVEMEEQAIKLARSRNLSSVVSIVQGYLPDAVPVDTHFDCVLALDVIEHIEQDIAALERIGELTKQNGIVIITVPAYQWLWSEHDVANHHKRRYTRASLLSAMRGAGLDVVYSSHFNTLLFPLAAISRLIASVFPGKKGEGQAEWEVSLPVDFINNTLYRIFRSETIGAGRWSIPFGLSIAAVARRAPAVST